MAYDRVKIFEQAKELVTKHNLYFIEDIVALLPCSKNYFYDHFPTDSNEYDELRTLLEGNRVNTKVAMRKKWNDSDNATLQMALMKLICNDNERKKLSITYSDNENKNENKNFDINKIYDSKTQTDLG
jgi:hypothetical protein